MFGIPYSWITAQSNPDPPATFPAYRVEITPPLRPFFLSNLTQWFRIDLQSSLGHDDSPAGWIAGEGTVPGQLAIAR